MISVAHALGTYLCATDIEIGASPSLKEMAGPYHSSNRSSIFTFDENN